jgi:hypothetical protein
VNLKQKILLILLVITLTPLLFRAAVNVFGLVVDSQNVYHIPEGSSLFTFRPTEMNSGSGDWWIYGEDNQHYFYFEDDVQISKLAAMMCPGFNKTDLTTWCQRE